MQVDNILNRHPSKDYINRSQMSLEMSGEKVSTVGTRVGTDKSYLELDTAGSHSPQRAWTESRQY